VTDPSAQGASSDRLLAAVEEVEHGRPALELPRTRVSDMLDAVVGGVGAVASWIWLVLMAAICLNVTLRYVFGQGYVAFEEIQWHLYGAGFIIGLSYAVLKDRHVRIDVLAERWPLRRRMVIELVLTVLFLLPFCASMFLDAVPFVVRSWELNEISAAPGGLPHRWAIKSFLLIGFFLLFLAGLARLLRLSSGLFGWPAARPGTTR